MIYLFEQERIRVTFDPNSVEPSKADLIVQYVKAHPGCSKNAICKAVGGNKSAVLELIDDLVTEEDNKLAISDDGKITIVRKALKFSSKKTA